MTDFYGDLSITRPGPTGAEYEEMLAEAEAERAALRRDAEAERYADDTDRFDDSRYDYAADVALSNGPTDEETETLGVCDFCGPTDRPLRRRIVEARTTTGRTVRIVETVCRTCRLDAEARDAVDLSEYV